MKLLMLKGLPASGKSTYAKKLADDGWVRVNKDDLRTMLHNGKWSKINEQQVLQLRDAIISNSLDAGKSVVVDDTNLAPKHAARLKELAKIHKATFETKFFDVSVEECIKRDLTRLNSVGEKVIRDMYKQFLAPQPQVYTPPTDKPHAIVCDIDGTLAHMNGRSPYDPTRYAEDSVDEIVREIVNRYYLADYKIIICSGRDDTYKQVTADWLTDNGIKYHELHMRPVSKDVDENGKVFKRKDWIVKQELFHEFIHPHYNVRFVLDDRNQVVDMWRSLGLTCLQVAEGDF